MSREGKIQINKEEIVLEYLHTPCRLVLSLMFFQPSDEHSSPVAWATSAGNRQFQTVEVERQLFRLTEGSKRKSRISMYYVKIKCQRMVGQCPACPIGRVVADWAALVEKALKWVRYSRLPCCFLQCCSAQYSEIADQAVWEACWTLKMSKYPFFFRARTRWGSFQRSPRPPSSSDWVPH